MAAKKRTRMGEEKCPICGKKFMPAQFHAYKIRKGSRYVRVCTYSCMRVWQKDREAKGRKIYD